MKLSKTLLALPVFTLLGAAAVASGACSTSVSFSTPANVQTLSGSPPSFLPSSCDDGTYYLVDSSDGLCSGSSVYYLCDGSSYTQYDCTDPASDGWTEASGDNATLGGSTTTTDHSSPTSTTSGTDNSSSGTDNSSSGTDNSSSGTDNSSATDGSSATDNSSATDSSSATGSATSSG